MTREEDNRMKRMLACLIASVAIAGTAYAAEEDDARAAATKFWIALGDQDVATLKETTQVQDEKLKRGFELYLRRIAAEKSLREEGKKRFAAEGERLGFSDNGNLKRLAEAGIQQLKQTPLTVEGEKRRLVIKPPETKPGQPAQGLWLDLSTSLVKKDDAWRVLLDDLTPPLLFGIKTTAARPEAERVMIEAREQTLADLQAGKFASATEAAQAQAQREKAGLEALRAARTQPVTAPATRSQK